MNALGQQGAELQQYLLDNPIGYLAGYLSFARSPIQTLDLIGKDYARHRQAFWKSNLEWIALYLGCNGTKES